MCSIHLADTFKNFLLLTGKKVLFHNFRRFLGFTEQEQHTVEIRFKVVVILWFMCKGMTTEILLSLLLQYCYGFMLTCRNLCKHKI